MQIYKIPDGKPENVFAFSGEAKPKVSSVAVVDWRDVFSETSGCGNRTISEVLPPDASGLCLALK